MDDLNGVRVLLATTLVADDRKTLACARSLGRAGAWVAVAGDDIRGEAYYSRYVRARLRVPHAGRDPEEFIASLSAHARRERIDVVLPMNDHVSVALSRLAADPARVLRTALSTPESIDVARDKVQTLALAARLGIDTPTTYAPQCEDDLREIARQVTYPCVCKPNTGSGADGVSFPRSPEELLEAFRRAQCASADSSGGDRVLIQELVPGEIHDACVLFHHGEPRAGLTQWRRWMYPQAGGMGVSVETTHAPELLDRAYRLLAALRWHGPACVEFRVDPDSGRTCLLEINGRLGGASNAGIHAGIDYPVLWTRLALAGDVEPVFDYRVGMRFRWPIPFGLLALAGPTPVAALREFFLPARLAHSDVAPRDPMPHVAEIVYGLQRVVHKVTSRRQARTA